MLAASLVRTCICSSSTAGQMSCSPLNRTNLYNRLHLFYRKKKKKKRKRPYNVYQRLRDPLPTIRPIYSLWRLNHPEFVSKRPEFWFLRSSSGWSVLNSILVITQMLIVIAYIRKLDVINRGFSYVCHTSPTKQASIRKD